MSYKGKNIWGLDKARVELRSRRIEQSLRYRSRMSNRFFDLRHARFFNWVSTKQDFKNSLT